MLFSVRHVASTFAPVLRTESKRGSVTNCSLVRIADIPTHLLSVYFYPVVRATIYSAIRASINCTIGSPRDIARARNPAKLSPHGELTGFVEALTNIVTRIMRNIHIYICIYALKKFIKCK